MNYWLVKQEPSSYSFDDFTQEKKTDWTGVRNYQARNNLAAMKKGDEVLYYHSGDEKAVVGLASVSKGPFPDPTDEKWTAVELKAGRKLKTPVTLTEIRAEPKLSEILLVRNSRISVIPLTRSEFDLIVKMSG